LHAIYYVFLKDLADLMEKELTAFEPVFKDAAIWVARIREVRLPRNIVGHMNWPQPQDTQRIDALYRDLQKLLRLIIASGKVTLVSPA
jgi:hypothetical protein